MNLSLFGVASHPGAARAVAPVVVEAARRGWHTVFATAEVSVPVAKRAGLVNPLVLESAEHAAVVLREMPRGTVVLAGVSEGDGAEKHAIIAARSEGIPCCAVLDNWGGYETRLTGTMGAGSLPDVLAVLNDEARRAIVEKGFFRGAVVVTGHPGLDEFTPTGPVSGTAARATFGIASDAEVIVFASQPIAQQFGKQLGYDQYEAFALLQAAARRESLLILALHPREGIEGWGRRLTQEVRIVRDYDPRALYAAADIVTSCFSAALTEALLAGRPAISIQPHVHERDELWTNACGATLAAYDVAQLATLLGAARAMTAAELAHRRSVLGIPDDATGRVMQLVQELSEKACVRPF